MFKRIGDTSQLCASRSTSSTPKAARSRRTSPVFQGLGVLGVDAQGEAHTSRPAQPARRQPWLKSIDQTTFAENAERIVRELNQVLQAPQCPVDDRSVILMPGQMYLQTRDELGTPWSSTAILGYELAFAGGSFVTLDDFGKLRYGSRN